MPELTQPVLQHRIKMLAELGFNGQQATELAESRDSRGFLVDIHDVRRTIKSGCPVATAFEIFA